MQLALLGSVAYLYIYIVQASKATSRGVKWDVYIYISYIRYIYIYNYNIIYITVYICRQYGPVEWVAAQLFGLPDFVKCLLSMVGYCQRWNRETLIHHPWQIQFPIYHDKRSQFHFAQRLFQVHRKSSWPASQVGLRNIHQKTRVQFQRNHT